jgi:hypothetical protein
MQAMTRDSVVHAVEAALGSAVVSWEAVSGGDINQAHEAHLADGRRVFVKSNHQALAGMFAAEARGLDWLGQARALRVPDVIAQGPDFLVLECLGRAGVGPTSTICSGADWPRFIARARHILVSTMTTSSGDWRSPMGRSRRGPSSIASAAFCRNSDWPSTVAGPARLCGKGSSVCLRAWKSLSVLPSHPHASMAICGAATPWLTSWGMPCLIDPAVYGGHREIDLAMMRLFGGFGPRVFAAYEEAFPLPHGHQARVPLYQLYFLMVHVNLFGGSLRRFGRTRSGGGVFVVAGSNRNSRRFLGLTVNEDRRMPASELEPAYALTELRRQLGQLHGTRPDFLAARADLVDGHVDARDVLSNRM